MTAAGRLLENRRTYLSADSTAIIVKIKIRWSHRRCTIEVHIESSFELINVSCHLSYRLSLY